MSLALVARYTESTGPGDENAQANPGASLGGYAATTAYAGGVLHDLFNRASTADVADARAAYRCFYVYNPDPAAAAPAVRVYLADAPALAVGADPRPATDLDSTAPQAVEAATGYAAPAGVTFTTPTDYAAGVDLGALPPLTGRAVWVKRTPRSVGFYDQGDVVVAASDGRALVRRAVWEVEAGSDKTAPFTVPAAKPTPTPFRRVNADFLTTGGARVTWELDNSLTDAGPYTFQLYASQSGVPDADDWVTVGPPAVDPAYLIDPTQRLWGMSSTLHYRLVLTTAVASYTSVAANVYGDFSKEQWLLVREELRKEQLMMRRFVGIHGWLLKARRYGTRCDCVSTEDGEIGNSSCATCYGQGLVGGYHPPVPFTYSTFVGGGGPGTKERVAYNESRGTTRPVTERGRVLATIPVVARDAWVVSGSDERYYIHEVTDLVCVQGVPIVYQLEFRLAPKSDILYAFPITRPADDVPPWRRTTTINI